MGIKLKVTDDDKKQMARFAVEEQVLIALAKEWTISKALCHGLLSC